MTAKAFRFAVQAVPGDAEQRLGLARRVEDAAWKTPRGRRRVEDLGLLAR